jgi:cytochrome c oxidase cbb3-type subunit 1
MIPRIWNTTLYSLKLVYVHFFLATIGTILYITAMWVSGIGQGLMLRAFDEFGNLSYSFIETVAFMHGPLAARAVGGLFFLTGMLVMAYNVYMTIARAKQEVPVTVAAAAKA